MSRDEMRIKEMMMPLEKQHEQQLDLRQFSLR